MSTQDYQHHRPTSLAEALELMAAPDHKLIAGGTDLMVQMRHGKTRRKRYGAMVSLRRVPELQGIDKDGDLLRIGAGATIADILQSQLVRDWAPALVSAAEVFASPQIRNMATLAGNLCNASPAADTAPPLLVYDATVEVHNTSGSRIFSIDQLFTGPGKTVLEPGDIVSCICIPPQTANTRSAFLRRGRIRMDIATASLAMALQLDGETCISARIAAGAVGPTPMRLHGLEDMLQGAQITDGLIAEGRRMAEQAVSPITDLRSTAEYRRHLIGVYFERAVKQIVGETR